MPIVKLLDTHIFGAPNSRFSAFGHVFTIQPNGEAHCDMHEDFIKTEVGAGRVELIAQNKKEKIKDSTELETFTFDIGNYYGAGDLDKLMKKLGVLRKSLLTEFADTRLKIELPDSMSAKDMRAEISDTVNHRIVTLKDNSDKEND